MVLNLSLKELMSVSDTTNAMAKRFDITWYTGECRKGRSGLLFNLQLTHISPWNQIFKIQPGYNDPHIIISKLSALMAFEKSLNA